MLQPLMHVYFVGRWRWGLHLFRRITFYSFRKLNHFSRRDYFNFEVRKKLRRAISGGYDGYSMVFKWCLVNKSNIIWAPCVGALSSSKIHELLDQNSDHMWQGKHPLNALKWICSISHSIYFNGRYPWCTTPRESRKIVNKTLTLERFCSFSKPNWTIIDLFSRRTRIPTSHHL